MNIEGYKLIVIGASYGGIKALHYLVPEISKITDLPIIITQHISKDASMLLAKYLNDHCQHSAEESLPDTKILPNHIYVAPSDYHLLVESETLLALSKDEPVQFSRPSIDVLFESAANVFESELISILLTGSNEDGARGTAYVHSLGGLTIAQNPKTAEMPTMPQAAIDTGEVEAVLDLDGIAKYLEKVFNSSDMQRGESHDGL